MKIDDSNREYSESEVRSFIKGLNARIANAEGVIDELKKENAELKKTTEFLRSMLGKSNDKVIKLKAERDEMESENERLKLMLKTVADDIEKHRTKAKENSCVMGCVEECLFYNDGRDSCEYSHMTEIKKLIGEENEL